MSIATDRLPVWTLATPFVALGVDLALHGSGSILVGLLLAIALLAAILAAVHHAEIVALRVGDPFGAVILALAVTVIELGLIVSILLGKEPEPTLVRDTIHAVVVLVLHGQGQPFVRGGPSHPTGHLAFPDSGTLSLSMKNKGGTVHHAPERAVLAT